MKRKQIQFEDERKRGVSPVIGVVLMVAVTVILAAVIGTFVISLGASTSANAQAGVSFSEDGDDVTVLLTSVERADNIYVQLEDENGETDFVGSDGDGNDRGDGADWEVGSSVLINTTEAGDGDDLSNLDDVEDEEIERIIVIGELDGGDTVISTWTE